MIALAVYTFLGGQLHLPAPGRSPTGRVGPASVYSLGLFSGMATSCCAPVLAGVIALAGVASSFALALGLGLAYVFGMVAPLFLVALLWEHFDWRSSALFRPRSITWKLVGVSRTMSLASLASVVLLAIMGVATVVVGLQGESMNLSGWQASFAVQLQQLGQQVTHVLSIVPAWALGLALALLLVVLAWRAADELGWNLRPAASDHDDEDEQDLEEQEGSLERQHA